MTGDEADVYVRVRVRVVDDAYAHVAAAVLVGVVVLCDVAVDGAVAGEKISGNEDLEVMEYQ